MKIIDLRSDTVTKPTQEMLEEMIHAEVGDDVYGEDPTVNQLETLAARMLGKESALFVTSGTQGNQLAVLSHTQRGDEVIVERSSHIYYFEVGGMSALSGVQPAPIAGIKGMMDIDEIEKTIRVENIHYPRTGLICLENTHNRGGGTVISLDYTKKVCELAKAHEIKTHLDGARLFNASVALGIPVSELASPFDSVQICLSKGLSAPVGSILAGNQRFIKSARKYRKMLGGGMRQAGVIAAAGIVALTKMADRLQDDHTNARSLALGLSKLPGLFIDMDSVQTNMVYGVIVEPDLTARQLADSLEKQYIRIHVIDSKTFRLVTHKDIDSNDIPIVVDCMQQFFARISATS
ncbi:low-specificity L-threonine aldolase [Paenibacillus sp. GP183]|uniref:low-specificity L-threonine aldolase n=1 Tax=Paenibacillus sp. GP183 TaxID=1882751 RepID=UPI0008943E66|nr:low-specificity L-threonine aldolase [Paenibacillus sp. GP183]SEB84821.1 L-threonine aldolase [Paenibacillus sp. GP183]